VTHVALFTWKPGTSDEQVRELTDALAARPDVMLGESDVKADVKHGADRAADQVDDAQH